MARGEQRVVDGAHLLRADGDHARLRRRPCVRTFFVSPGRRACCRARRRRCVAMRVSDCAEVAHVVELVDEVGEARRPRGRRRSCRLVLLVDLDQAQREPVDGRASTAAEEDEPAASGACTARSGCASRRLWRSRSAWSVARCCETSPTLGLEAADLCGHPGDLRRERGLARPRRVDACAERADAAVDRVLAAVDVPGRGRGSEDEPEAEHEAEGAATAHLRKVRARVGRPFRAVEPG